MSTRRRSRTARCLFHEPLESRCLLAGLAGSLWQNPLSANDLDGDGVIAPSDAIAAINALNSGVSGALAGRLAPPALNGRVAGAAQEFLDASGDGKLTPLDPVLVINQLNDRRGPGSPVDDLPAEDQQPGEISPDLPELELTDGGAKVRARLNGDVENGDIDVFRIVPAKNQLSVALFAPRGTEITVEVLDKAGAVQGSATTGEEGSKRLARVHVDDVATGENYYIRVSSEAGDTGVYGLQVLAFDDREFKPKTDAELGDDIHGDEASLDDSVPADERATELVLTGRRASVRSNIDTAGDRDVFAISATGGKLIVEAGAEFALTVEIIDPAGEIVAKDFPDHRPLIVNASPGTYFVAVQSADTTSTGPYRLHVVNAQGPHDHEDEPNEPTDPASDPPIPPGVRRIFGRIDANNDGNVTREELAAAQLPALKFKPLDDILEQWDTDGVEGLSLDELAAGLATLRTDRPHDAPSPERRPLLSRLFD